MNKPYPSLNRRKACLMSCRAIAAGMALITLGCGGSPAQPAPLVPEERATIRDGQAPAGAITVALRVTLDAPTDSERVHLHAVTYGLDGRETTTDLGEYVGTVLHEPSNGAELIRVAIESARGRRAIRLTHHDGFVHAEEVPGDGTDATLIERIPIPEGTPVRPSDTPVERTPAGDTPVEQPR